VNAEGSLSTDWWHLRRAGASLRLGGVWAYPTEAVWGLGCDPWNQSAVDWILTLKERPHRKGLILAAATIEQVAFLLEPLPASLRDSAVAYWPGPTTLLLPDPQGLIPRWIKGEHERVAIRVSAHPGVQRLCTAFGGPLVSTSCNRAGRSPARWSWQVRRTFGGALDGILPGSLGGASQPSRILDPLDGRRLR